MHFCLFLRAFSNGYLEHLNPGPSNKFSLFLSTKNFRDKNTLDTFICWFFFFFLYLYRFPSVQTVYARQSCRPRSVNVMLSCTIMQSVLMTIGRCTINYTPLKSAIVRVLLGESPCTFKTNWSTQGERILGTDIDYYGIRHFAFRFDWNRESCNVYARTNRTSVFSAERQFFFFLIIAPLTSPSFSRVLVQYFVQRTNELPNWVIFWPCSPRFSAVEMIKFGFWFSTLKSPQ